MKFLFISLFISTAIIIIGCSTQTCTNIELTDDFYNDLAIENNRLDGELALDVFNDNLEQLTFDFYIDYLTKTQVPSAEGLVETIRCADEKHLFANPNYFILVLHYKDKRTIIGDNSDTAIGIDSIYIYSPEGAIPSVEHFAEQLK